MQHASPWKLIITYLVILLTVPIDAKKQLSKNFSYKNDILTKLWKKNSFYVPHNNSFYLVFFFDTNSILNKSLIHMFIN